MACAAARFPLVDRELLDTVDRAYCEIESSGVNSSPYFRLLVSFMWRGTADKGATDEPLLDVLSATGTSSSVPLIASFPRRLPSLAPTVYYSTLEPLLEATEPSRFALGLVVLGRTPELARVTSDARSVE